MPRPIGFVAGGSHLPFFIRVSPRMYQSRPVPSERCIGGRPQLHWDVARTDMAPTELLSNAIRHYTGTLSNGKKFDSSRDRGQPFRTQIGVGQVIRGWDEGVPTMSLGEKAILRMTSDFGYGPRGAGNVIPPNADLTFEVELLRIN
mmetsp:Transcript_35988/g.84152  ORF Transcript_35988/g.84152 Transcript_35988/m.84152 type:complete len:146 (+) Transcript_35988:448-885(+)